MKTVLISAFLLLTTFSLWGQENISDSIVSGKITYEEKTKHEFKNRDNVPPQFANMPPRERTSIKELLFTKDATLFQQSKVSTEDVNMQPERGGGGGMMFGRMGGGESQAKIYTDLNKNTIIEQREFMNRFFCIDRTMPERRWKVTGNQKTILGYQCFEAFDTDTSGIKTIVWFTPSIAVKGGPALYSNLPGMVLEVSASDGSRSYVATSVESVPGKKLKLSYPEGKKITEAEYREMVMKKMKEMEMENPGGRPGQGGFQRPGMGR